MGANLLSMTGYGEAVSAAGDREWRCVVQSVNSRNLDARFRLPSSLHSLELQLRKSLQKVIARGKVDVVFSFNMVAGSGTAGKFTSSLFNSDWVADFCRSGESLLDSLAWQSSDSLRSAFLQSAFTQRDAFAEPVVEIDSVADLLDQLLQKALSHHLDSRKREGELLAVDMLERLALLREYLVAISEHAALMPQSFKERIALRIDTLIDKNQFEVDLSRMTQEVAHLIDKADVSEEIVRFNAHIDQFCAEINDSAAERKGKKLEFIVQEMLREINTVGSKANLLEVTRLVVEVKNELEKIREQVQNVV